MARLILISVMVLGGLTACNNENRKKEDPVAQIAASCQAQGYYWRNGQCLNQWGQVAPGFGQGAFGQDPNTQWQNQNQFGNADIYMTGVRTRLECDRLNQNSTWNNNNGSTWQQNQNGANQFGMQQYYWGNGNRGLGCYQRANQMANGTDQYCSHLGFNYRYDFNQRRCVRI